MLPNTQMQVAILLFEGFETLDVFGPVEILGRIKDKFKISFYSLSGGMIGNEHGVSIATQKVDNIFGGVDIFLIPGGPGTRVEIENAKLINTIRNVSEASQFVFTVCTGSALLAKSGLLNNRQATSNKRAFDWVSTFGDDVQWVRKARWTVDGKYYTSSGVSAGMDMTFGFLSDIHGVGFARNIAYQMEYEWQENKAVDNFFKQ